MRQIGFVAGIYALMMILGSGLSSFGQSVQQKPSSYAGRHFYVGYMQNEVYVLQGGVHLYLHVGASVPSNVQIYVGANPTPYVFSIKKDSVLSLEIPYTMEMIESEIARQKSVEIASDNPIVVYGISSQRLTSDGFTALPTAHWGREYIVVSMPNDAYENPLDADMAQSRSSQFMIVAAEDRTLVTYTPTSLTEFNKQPGVPTYVYLNRGDCYLVKSSPDYAVGEGDLTGTTIVSDKPIGVFSGHIRTSIPTVILNGDYDSMDHLTEMLIPSNLWGRSYQTIPFLIPSPGDMIKVVAKEANTVIAVQGQVFNRTITLANAGESATVYPANEPLSWSSDKQFGLMQFMATSFSSQSNMQGFDPAMVVVAPSEQFVSRALFFAPSNPPINPKQFSAHFINIVCTPSAVHNLRLDGSLVAGDYPRLEVQSIGTNGNHWVSLPVKPGTHVLEADSGFFSGTLYGVGNDDSYALPLGMSLFSSSIVDNTPPLFDSEEHCGIVQGSVVEPYPPSGSYIRTLEVDADSTVNYTVSMGKVSDTSTRIAFRAEPTDPTKDAVLMLRTSDGFGNVRTVVYRYSALKLDYTRSIAFNAKDGEIQCTTIVLRNNDKQSILFESSFLTGDNRLHFGGNSSDPLQQFVLAPGKEVSVQICFDPGSSSKDLVGEFHVVLPCNLRLKTAISGNVIAPNLAALDYDFGDVVLGDTACGFVRFVNTGNTAVRVAAVVLTKSPPRTLPTIPSPDIYCDTAGVFPVVLNPNDTLRVRACFAPKERATSSAWMGCINDWDLPAAAQMRGRGIAPDVASAALDWRQRRVGTNNDTTLTIVNNGNMPAELVLDELEGDTASFLTPFVSAFPMTIPAQGKLTFSARFTPVKAVLYDFLLRMSVKNWRLHLPVSFALKGEGTLPGVDARTIVFDTIGYDLIADTLAVVFDSFGNESLTVDSLSWISGDSSAFSFVEDLNIARVVPTDSSWSAHIRFRPLRIGAHRALLAIHHDAAPNYARRVDTAILVGFAKKTDTLTAAISLLAPESVALCSDSVFTAIIRNTGNKELQINEISVQAVGAVVQEMDSPLVYPYILPVNETLERKYNIRSMQTGMSEIVAVCRWNDTLTAETKATLQQPPQPLHITNVDVLQNEIFPGDNVSVLMRGTASLPNTAGLDPESNLSIVLDIFYLPQVLAPKTDVQPMFRFVSATGESTDISANATEISPGTLRLRAITPYNRSQFAQWEVSSNFLALLSPEHSTLFAVEASADRSNCYVGDSLSTTVNISPVCVDRLRPVGTPRGVFWLLSASPQPSGSETMVDFFYPEDGEAMLELRDVLGRQCLTTTLRAGEGRNKIAVELQDIPSGSYILIMHDYRGRTQTLPITVAK